MWYRSIIAIWALILISVNLYVNITKDRNVELDNVVKTITLERVSPKFSSTEFEQWAIALPASPFRGNILTVLGADKAGDSSELNKLLQSYSKIKIEENEELKHPNKKTPKTTTL
jgi:hypothetical protein